jgi:hypothetical protein
MHLLSIPGCSCGDINLTATDEWKTLNSPNYPYQYCNYMNCAYVLTAPKGQIVSVNLSFVDLEYGMDTLTFYDGASTNSTKTFQ